MNIKGNVLTAIVLVISYIPPSMAGQEVLNGSYSCEGFVGVSGIISLRAELGATSGITSGLRSTARSLQDLPADLESLSQICDFLIEQALTQIPQVCAVGAISNVGQFPPEFGISRSFDFSCKAGRNIIMDAISVLSRVPLTAGMP